MKLRLEDTGRTCNGRAVFMLTHDLEYQFEAKGLKLVVPCGFETDFHSTPWFLWPLYSPTGKGRLAAVIHDWLYREEASCCRFLADAIYRDVMFHENVSLIKRVLGYYGVRLFGRWSYHAK